MPEHLYMETPTKVVMSCWENQSAISRLSQAYPEYVHARDGMIFRSWTSSWRALGMIFRSCTYVHARRSPWAKILNLAALSPWAGLPSSVGCGDVISFIDIEIGWINVFRVQDLCLLCNGYDPVQRSIDQSPTERRFLGVRSRRARFFVGAVRHNIAVSVRTVLHRRPIRIYSPTSARFLFCATIYLRVGGQECEPRAFRCVAVLSFDVCRSAR